ncbi:MAG: RNA methyltransferase, partial [Gammaproteobacteria bacterium]|nr:RNA methyltransferase [Gammaproteobacteria bacterium]
MNSDDIHIVLVETSHPGNIGATARAMKTMGLTRLRLVKPKIFPDADATARASGADDILDTAQVFGSLQEAIADCVAVVGTTARSRTLSAPVISPRNSAARIAATLPSGPVAMVFGRERAGLSNDELDHCNWLVNIPANPDFSSLNLAMAVQLIAYEIRLALGAGGVSDRPRQLAPAIEME